MEIRRVLRGENTGFPSRPTRKAESKTAGTVRPATDRLELSRRWVENMEEQSARLRALFPQTAGEQEGKDEGGLPGYMETEEEKLDGLSEALDTQMKCLKIAMNMMKGKKVPPEDERYLMEHDPNGYKVAIAMKALVKEDKRECKSVLDDGDKNGGGTEESSGSGEAAQSPSGGGEAASSESAE